VLTHTEARARLRRIFGFGVYDAYRLKNEANEYSWWDYRIGAFDRDDGLRIDHVLLSPQACDALEGCSIKKELRALERASDHAPVIASFRL
jgi:exodeoxyribonuclease-3